MDPRTAVLAPVTAIGQRDIRPAAVNDRDAEATVIAVNTKLADGHNRAMPTMQLLSLFSPSQLNDCLSAVVRIIRAYQCTGVTPLRRYVV